MCESEVWRGANLGREGKVRREEKEQSYVEAKVSQRRRGNGRQGAVEEEGAPIRPRSCVRKDGDRARASEQAESDTTERRGLRAWRAWPGLPWP